MFVKLEIKDKDGRIVNVQDPTWLKIKLVNYTIKDNIIKIEGKLVGDE